MPITDPDVVELISKGEREFFVHDNKYAARAMAALSCSGKEILYSQFVKGVWVSAKLKPHGQRVNSGTNVVLYYHGMFLPPGEKSPRVLVGHSK